MGRTWVMFAVLAVAILALLPATASAGEPLFARSCVLASARAMSVDEAEARGGWACDPTPGDAVADHVWVRIPGKWLPAGADQRIEGDAMPLEGIVTVVRFADGSRRSHAYDPGAVARHWTVGTRFSLPLYGASERPVAAYVRIDRPFDRQIATALQLEEAGAAASHRVEGMVLFGVFFGMLLVATLYALSLFVVLRARFALAHAGMVSIFALYTAASSSMVFIVFPGTSLWVRTSLAYGGLALSMAMLAPLLVGFLERNALSRPVRRFAYASAGLLIVNAALVPLLGRSFPFTLRGWYHAAYIPGILTFCALCYTAWRRGSRAIRLIGLSWSLAFVFAVERILRSFGLYELPFKADFAFFFAMAFQSVVMVLAIAWRIGEVRRERDRAIDTGRELSAQVQTDALTGLPNRRAFDARHWRGDDFLAVVDIDHFKRVNDTHGHATGDAVLRAIGGVLAAETGSGAVVGAWRMGGEEFTVLLSSPSIDAAALSLNTLRGRIAAGVKSAVAVLDRPLAVSAGLARIGEEGIEAAYEAADRALYHAKASGRDRLSWDVADNATATIFPRRSKARAA